MSQALPLKGHQLLPKDLTLHGTGLVRPECVLCTRDGSRYVSHWQGGVTHLFADGTQKNYFARNAEVTPRPNGIALMPDGSFLLADLGTLGGVWRLDRHGDLSPFLTHIGGTKLPPCNFVMLDRKDRVWITCSTRQQPRQRAQRPDVADGFIIMVDATGPRIVAEELGYTNEVAFDANLDWLYVNETCARRLSRFRLHADGSLHSREVVMTFGPGDFPDGLAMDEDGGVWVVSIVSNRVYRISASNEPVLIVEDSQAEHLEWVEHAFQNGNMNPEHFGQAKSRQLQNVSSIAFGGPDLRTAWLGSLQGESLARFQVPVAGLSPVHWDWTHTGLER